MYFLSALCQFAATSAHLRLSNASVCCSGLLMPSNGKSNSLLSNSLRLHFTKEYYESVRIFSLCSSYYCKCANSPVVHESMCTYAQT